MTTNSTPVLIFAPGLGGGDGNTGDRIAEVVARALDNRSPGAQFSTKSDAAISAPRGLTVAKTVVNQQDAPVLQVFQLDYKTRLERPTGVVGPPAPPGVVRCTQYVVFGCLRLFAAWRRPAKTWTAKLQLLLGFVGAIALALAWFVALFAALVAAGVKMPGFLDGAFGENAASWTFGIAGTAAVITWSAVRKQGLALAATMRQLVDYVRDADRTRGTACLTVDDAIAGLRDAEWVGPIHLLGYSFGSLVLFDAAFPPATAQKESEPLSSIASLTTVGCPIDLVRLYDPRYTADREARRAGLPWVNIYNAADVFASNLIDGSDETSGAPESGQFATFGPDSVRYLNEELTLTQILMAKGFRTHAGYWGSASEAHCFERILTTWAPSTAPSPAAPE